jgi:hypothetical protein
MGEAGLLDAQQLGRLDLGEAALLDEPVQLCGDTRSQRPTLGIGQGRHRLNVAASPAVPMDEFRFFLRANSAVIPLFRKEQWNLGVARWNCFEIFRPSNGPWILAFCCKTARNKKFLEIRRGQSALCRALEIACVAFRKTPSSGWCERLRS